MPHKIHNIHYRFSSIKENIEFALENCDYLLIPVFQETENKVKNTSLMEIIELHFPLTKIFKKEEFYGDQSSCLWIPNQKQASFIFVGMGKVEKIPQYYKEAKLMKNWKNALALIHKKKIPSIAMDITNILEVIPQSDVLSLIVNMLIVISDYTYHSLEAKEISREIQNVYILSQNQISRQDQQWIQSVIDARSSTMDLVNIPSNIKKTDTLVEKARSLKKWNLKIEIIDDINWIQENMPCFYTVAKGSIASDPPKWIKVQYIPSTEIRYKIALIGKSVIFDTGGYQVKPDTYMNTMKADMTGGATVLSVIEQAARLKIPYIQLTAYCAVTPNKIDSDAMLPDSIVPSASGKKIEIRHTDAEGRLTLIDAIAMAEKEQNDLFLTVATLTGSAARAVGPRIALMATDIQWREKFENACKKIGEPVQTLDVEEEDYEDIKSKLDGADINNTGSEKYRGAQTAAAFIFSGLSSQKPCIHLDIAGGDMTKDEKATGISVKGIMNFLREIAKEM